MNITKKELFYSLLFTMFLITYMAVLSVTDSIANGLSDEFALPMLHYLPGFTRIVGFISFGFSRRLIKSTNKRYILLIFTGMIFLVSSTVMALVSSSAVLPFVFLLSLSLGYTGGLIYYCLSIALTVSVYKGRLLGICCALSVLIQLIMQNLIKSYTQLALAAFLIVLLIIIYIKAPSDYILEDPLPFASEDENFDKTIIKQLAVICLIIFIMTLMACHTDISFLNLSFAGNINIYSYPRLFMILGYVTLGFIVDIKGIKVFTSAFFCGILISFVLVLMPFANDGFNMFLSVYYLFISIYIFFYTYSFMSLAPRTSFPELWAAGGRPISELLTCIITFLMMKASIHNNLSPLIYCVFYIIMTIALYVMLTSIYKDPYPESKIKETPDVSSSVVSSVNIFDNYCLTPREKEVAEMLIESDLSMKAIALEMNISERSLYRYSSSIYEKTGAQNRPGLIKLLVTGTMNKM